MTPHHFPISLLVDKGTCLTKEEALKRYRLLSIASAAWVQWLTMLSFSRIGRTETGELYYC
jgi:hypothetical protein